MPIIANRVVVIGEERRVLADGTPEEILADHDLLIRANLIHEHLHEQGVRHGHEHLIHDHLARTGTRGRLRARRRAVSPGPRHLSCCLLSAA